MKPKPPPTREQLADTWKPHETPGFEINGLGHLKTHDHKPGAPPKKPEPVVTEGSPADWAGMGAN